MPPTIIRNPIDMQVRAIEALSSLTAAQAGDASSPPAQESGAGGGPDENGDWEPFGILGISDYPFVLARGPEPVDGLDHSILGVDDYPFRLARG